MIRKSAQYLLPEQKPEASLSNYDIYPALIVPENQIGIGFEAFASKIQAYASIAIDGYIGVLFEDFKTKLEAELTKLGKSSVWIAVSDCLKHQAAIDELLAPFLGGQDPLFGTRTTCSLTEFFEPGKLDKLVLCESEDKITIVYGIGAFLVNSTQLRVYIDLPKNEIQFRSRAGSITNLGCQVADDPKKMYKRFYFVDWVVLNKHKHAFLSSVDIFIDGQHTDSPSFISGESFREALKTMSINCFRVRPWFEPGTWGGQWIKENIPGLAPDVPNYAWSFELIVPENGLLLQSSNILLELSFDCLMFTHGKEVLGEAFETYGVEFPIRFDFLDTVKGGNLSVQCHPVKAYMKEHFGEGFTQEETYYILDSTGDAEVYLGFNNDIDKSEFEAELKRSYQLAEPLQIEKYVQKHPAKKHDLFLIPPGTIHASGQGNVVLEISSTPYIFTFKMYDWLRPDLDGKPRPLNIDRAMQNLNFNRKGEVVQNELICRPNLIKTTSTAQLYHLKTHPAHLYDVYRVHFTTEVSINTQNSCHVLSLVQGTEIEICTLNMFKTTYHYAETFVVPAASQSYKIRNLDTHEAWVVMAFVKSKNLIDYDLIV
jgi:mannose-6-phosphate isomerase class I